jgi:hypothetical protein
MSEPVEGGVQPRRLCRRLDRTVMLKLPGADDIMLYEPRHPTAYDL